jgi:hypothetical protein
MVKATLRTNTPKPNEAPAIDVASEKIDSTLAQGTGTGKPEDLTGLLPDQTGNPAEEAPAAKSETALTKLAPRSTTKYQPAAVEGFDGDWGSDDVKFPQLKLVQGSGPLSQQFDAGTVIYGDLELLPPPSVKEGAVNPTITFAPIAITKQWREKLNQDQATEGMMPRIVNTLAEVEEYGGTTRWVGNEIPDNYWEPSARCILLIEQPEGNEHPGFALELDGKLYAVAVYYAAGGAFRASAKVIFNTAMTSLLVPVLDAEGKPVVKNGRPVKKPMLFKNFWKLSFGKVKAGNFNPWRPTVKLLPKVETGPEVRAYCEGLTQSTEAVSEAAASE